MNGLGTDVLAVACIVGGAAVSGGATFAAMRDGAGSDVCEAQAIATQPVVVRMGHVGQGRSVDVRPRIVRVERGHGCAMSVWMNDDARVRIGDDVRVRIEDARARAEDARGRVDEARGRVEEARERIEAARSRADAARERAEAVRVRLDRVRIRVAPADEIQARLEEELARVQEELARLDAGGGGR